METRDLSKNGVSRKILTIKKNLIYATLLIAFSIIGQAKVFAQESEEIELGVKAGLNIANAVSNKEHWGGNSIVGYNAGFFLDIPLKKFTPNLYLQPGLSLTMKNGGAAYADYESGSIHYLKVPVLLSYRYPLKDKLKAYVDFGPYFSYGLFSNGIELGNESWGSSGSDERYNISTQRFDAGLALGAGIKFKRLSLGLQYDLGLTNILIESNTYIKTRTLSINVAYNISNDAFRSIGRAFSNIDDSFWDDLSAFGSALQDIGNSLDGGGTYNNSNSGSSSNSASSNNSGSGSSTGQRTTDPQNCKNLQRAYDGHIKTIQRIFKEWSPDVQYDRIHDQYNRTNKNRDLLRENLRDIDNLKERASRMGCSVKYNSSVENEAQTRVNFRPNW